MPALSTALERRSPLLLLTLLCVACGGEQAPESGRPQSAAGPGPVAEPSDAPIRAPVAGLPPERAGLEALPLESLFPPRPAAVPQAIQRDLERREPESDGWGAELLAQAAERSLAQILTASLAGREVPADLLARAAGEIKGLELDYPGRSAQAAEAPEVQVEVTAYDQPGPAEFEAVCWVALVRRPRPAARAESADAELLAPGEAWEAHDAAFQLTFEVDTRWQVVAGRPRLVDLLRRAPAGPELASASGAALFEEHTRAAFGSDAAFDEELLRGPDATYFHSDRLSGYDLVANHGLAVGDVNDDGWEDVYVGMPSGAPNRLFLRLPDGGTREAALEYKVAFLDSTRSALILDLDGDGRRDLACAMGGDVRLSWSDGKTFAESSVLRPPSGEDVFSMAAADFDLDGDLDLYACRYSSQGVMQGNPTPYHDALNGSANLLWRNEGGRAFVEAAAEHGLDAGNTRYSFSALWEDLDDDGDPDLYVANDFGRNHYWRNDGGRFVDVADEVGAADMAAGMGIAAGDVDSDGDEDLYVSNMYAVEGLRSTSRPELFLHDRPPESLELYRRHARGNTLLINRGDGTYEDRSESSGSARGGWAWGAQFFDADNDGDLDIYSPNGFLTRRVPGVADEFFWRYVIARSPMGGEMTPEYHDAWYTMQYLYFELGEGWNGEEPNVMFLGDGHGRFVDASGISGADFEDDARSLTVLDWDRDGFLDLLTKNRSAPRLRLLRNRGSASGADAWLVVELVAPSPNRDAIGARVRVLTDRGSLRRSVRAGDGFLAQSTNRLHFGLGQGARIEALEVRWPDGLEQRFEGPIESGQAQRIVRGADEPEPMAWEPIRKWSQAEPETLEQLPGINRRTVLFDKLPLAPLTLPTFGGGDRRVGHLGGRPLLVYLWRSGDEASEGQLLRFARAIDRIDEIGLTLVPMSIDSGASLSSARRRCEELGLGDQAGYADGWTMQALEVLLLEVYHRPDSNTVPTALLLDRAGQLCVVYQGPVGVDLLLEDVAVLKQMDTRQGTCARLQRGRWVARPQRDLGTLASVFAGLGYQELSAYYAKIAELRR